MVVLIDAKYFGVQIHHGRCEARLTREEAAALLGLTYKDLLKIEGGAMCMPEGVLLKLCLYGFTLLNARKMDCYNKKKMRKKHRLTTDTNN